MAVVLLLLMIGVPIAEIAVFIEVGGRIGLGPTLGTVVLTAAIGTALLRHQGLATLRRFQESLAQNRMPMTELFDGLCLLVAGALLLTPGFVTDGVGLVLFFPPARAALRRLLGRYLVASGRAGTGGPGPGGGGPTVIEADYKDVTPGRGNGNNSGPPAR